MFWSDTYKQYVQHVYVNGKRVGTVRGNTQPETKKKAQAMEKEFSKMLVPEWRNKKVQDLTEVFLERKKKKERSTYRWYENMVKHIDDNIGDMKLRNVTSEDLEELLDDLAKKNQTTGKPTKQKTLSHVTNTIKQVFKFAADKNFIDVDPAKTLEVPKEKEVPKKLRSEEENEKEKLPRNRCLSEEEIGWILNTPHKLQTANMILLYTGMRPEELLALRWKDINLKKGCILIDKALKYDGNKPYVGDTKTNKIRVVVIPQELLDYLVGVYPKDKPNALVVSNSKGKYLTKSAWRQMYHSYIIDLDIKYGGKFKTKFHKHYKMTIHEWTPYALRHTSTTYGAKEFRIAKKELAENQGHTEETMTKYYEGEMLKIRREEINKVTFKKLTENANEDKE